MSLMSVLFLAAAAVTTADEIVLPIATVVERPDLQASVYPGRVTPIAQVDVVPQVSGEILEVCFENGQLVKEGDVLYKLDPVKYQSAVKNAESKLAECKANVHYAELSYERHKSLLETRAVSLDAVDNALSLRDSSRAAFAAAQAALVAAQDDLKHCTITAPIAGKAGSTTKTKGNFVSAGALTLVNIVQQSPIRVRFSLANRDILELAGGEGRRRPEDISLRLTLANGKSYAGEGCVEYMENQADELTDTVIVYARFANEDRKLIPGGVVSVGVSSRKGVMRPAIPPGAILQDTQGPYVWVLDEQGRAERRSVARGDLVGEWLFVERGLELGEKVVADGAHRVKRGMKVRAP